MTTLENQHIVECDHAGYSEHDRVTCHTCKETLVRQPWMTLEDWWYLKEQFLAHHSNQQEAE
jgi:hypothetical protein